MPRLDDLNRFYDILKALRARVGDYRVLAHSSGRLFWPRRGVYFFFEEGEKRATGSGLRVVRVGTHALGENSKSTLWGRLRTHRGPADLSGGNHRGSVFRLHVGTALIRSGMSPVPVADTWGKDSSASRRIRERERPLEGLASSVISKMPFLWVGADDDPGPNSVRALIERNAIALLSNYDKSAVDPPSPSWLGRHCANEFVRGCGLWNDHHVGDSYDPDCLEVLGALVRKTPLGERSTGGSAR